jgi:hypothetical protein
MADLAKGSFQQERMFNLCTLAPATSLMKSTLEDDTAYSILVFRALVQFRWRATLHSVIDLTSLAQASDDKLDGVIPLDCTVKDDFKVRYAMSEYLEIRRLRQCCTTSPSSAPRTLVLLCSVCHRCKDKKSVLCVAVAAD